MALLSPSMLSSNFFNLENDIRSLEKAKVDMLHLDVMDGVFVPNISFAFPVIEAIRKNTDLTLDVHLMITEPHRYIKKFAPISDYLGFHYEAGSPIEETLKEIKELGCKPCLTIKPCTEPEEIFPFLHLCDMVLVMSVEPGFGGQKFMPDSLRKVKILKEEITRRGLNVLIEIDGGINEETAPLAVEAGTDVIVAGSYIFAEDMVERVKKIKAL